MLSLEESLKILKETNALLEGHFILSSGLHSPQYVQCAQLMSKPSEAFKICSSLSEKIKKEFKKAYLFNPEPIPKALWNIACNCIAVTSDIDEGKYIWQSSYKKKSKQLT